MMICLFAVGSAAMAQSKSADEFHNKYQGDRDATVVKLNGSIFNLVANIAAEADEADEDAQALARIAKEINSIKILSVPVYKSGLEPDDIKQLRNDLISEKYDELMTVRDGSDRIYFLAQGDEKEVRNMYVLIQEDREFTMLSIDGRLKMADLSYLANHHKDINID